jgi:hypothetical protein
MSHRHKFLDIINNGDVQRDVTAYLSKEDESLGIMHNRLRAVTWGGYCETETLLNGEFGCEKRLYET